MNVRPPEAPPPPCPRLPTVPALLSIQRVSTAKLSKSIAERRIQVGVCYRIISECTCFADCRYSGVMKAAWTSFEKWN
jgi:hypothetical protein